MGLEGNNRDLSREVKKFVLVSWMSLEGAGKEGDTPVSENQQNFLIVIPKYLRERKPWGKQALLWAKAKYYLLTDSELVPWGKGEKQPGEGVEIVPETILPAKSQSYHASLCSACEIRNWLLEIRKW